MRLLLLLLLCACPGCIATDPAASFLGPSLSPSAVPPPSDAGR